MSVIATIALVPALVFEHTRSYSPSMLLGSYFSLATLFEITKARSYLMRDGLPPVGYPAAVIAMVKLSIAILEEWPKRTFVLSSERRQKLGAEGVSGFWSRALFWWINSTLMKGFKTLFNPEDLADLEPEFTSSQLSARFLKFWTNANKKAPYALLCVCMRTLWSESLKTMVPKALMAGFMSTQPYMTKTVVYYAGVDYVPAEVVGGLVAAAVFVYTGIAITTALGEYFMSRQMVMIRTVLLTSIFAKLFELDSESLKRSNAVTLSSADVNNIMISVLSFHRMWQNGLLVIAGCVVLGFLVGTAAVFIVIPTLITLLISMRLTTSIRPAQKVWNAALDARITSTTDVLASIISVKMSGLTEVASNSVKELMSEEARCSQKFRALKTWNYVLGETTGNWAAVVVLAAALFWTRASTGLSLPDIYGILSVCVLITEPLGMFIDGFSQFGGALASFDRIQAFLGVENLQDSREFPAMGEKHDEKEDEKVPSIANAVELLDVSTKPFQENGSQLFRHLTLRFPANKLSVILGPVGCGKSTLLKTILGEIAITDGRVLVENESLAYCGQIPWLENTSIKRNIVGGYPFVESRYNETVKACCLTTDISSLPGGDEYKVGDNGSNLSGGQRQRVALARAIYTAKPTLILDDPLSGLDQDTAKAIFAHLFGENGLLSESRSSVIMVTTLAAHVQSAFQIVTISAAGFVRTERALDVSRIVIPSYLAQDTDAAKSDSESEVLRKHNQKPKSLAVQQAIAKQPDVLGEHSLARQRGDIGVYGMYLAAVGIKSFFFWLFLMFIGALSNRFPLIFVRIWYSANPTNEVYFAGFASISVASVFAWLAAYWYWYNYLVMKTTVSLHNILLDTIMHSTMAFLTRTENASLVNRFTEDISIFSQRLPAIIVSSISSMMYVLVDLGLLCSSSTIGIIILPICLVPFYFLQRFYLRSSRQLRQMQLETQVPVVKQVTEVSAGIEHIRSMKMHERLIEQGHQAIDESTKPVYYMRCIQQWLSLVVNMELMVISVIIIVISLTAKHLASANAVGVGMVTLIPLSEQMGIAVRAWTEVEIALGAMARLKWFTQNTPKEANATATEEAKVAMASWPANGKVEFKKACASYQVGGPLVLNNMSFIADAGTNFGITGRTGAGKSSILLTALGFLDYQGSILIDNTELRSVPLDILRSRITTITQSSIELPGTIRQNLHPGGSPSSSSTVSDCLLIEMMDRLGLWEYVDMHGGLEAEMSSLGLSQGQRQLLNIARAMVHQAHNKTKIVIMDEVSTCFNEKEGTRVLEILDDQFESCTVLMVEHRPSAIQYLDYQLKVKKGCPSQIAGRQDAHALLRAERREKQRLEKEQAESRILALQGGASMSDSASSTSALSFEPLTIDTTDRRMSLQERRRRMRTQRPESEVAPKGAQEESRVDSSEPRRSTSSAASAGSITRPAPPPPTVRRAPPPPAQRSAPPPPTLRPAPRAPVRSAPDTSTRSSGPAQLTVITTAEASTSVAADEPQPTTPRESRGLAPQSSTGAVAPQQSSTPDESPLTTPRASSRSNTRARRDPL